jgi:hypothetical protein
MLLLTLLGNGTPIAWPQSAATPPAIESPKVDSGQIALMEVCVDATGKLTQEPRIVESTGEKRLDEGAIALAKNGNYQTMHKGPGCFRFRMKFALTP